ncbi:MAG: hypothetical protein WBS54_03010, partial [Acidobacteriota bacterium]
SDELLMEHGIAFRGRPLPVTRTPFDIGGEALGNLTDAVKQLWRAAEIVSEAFVQTASLRELFGYGSLQMECILKDPGYQPAIPLGRMDSFLFPDGPRFMEFNTDGTAGWHYAAALSALWRRETGRRPECAPLQDKLLKALISCFRQWDRRGIENPRIAIVDWEEVGTRPEQEALAAFFTESGFAAALEDPRGLRVKDGRLAGRSGAIDLVYRRVVSEELFARADQVRPFLDAYLGDAACFVGGFRTDPAWSKTLFVLLSDPAFAHLYPEQVRASLASSIPWTRLLARGETAFNGEVAEMETLILRRPAEFILKPARGYEGSGVLAGGFTPPARWREAVQRGLLRGDTVVQAYLRPESSRRDRQGCAYLQVGEFVLLGHLAGFLPRLSATPLITPDQPPERYCPVATEIP